jgi:antitoxin (DNA-binding transcriptional repressor) of toxin-antitoxin stability system
MKPAGKTPAKTLSVTEFKAHCTEELRIVEETGSCIGITRHGKTIAYVEAAGEAKPKTVAHLIGSLEGSVSYVGDDDPDAPAIPHEDWAMHQDDAD